MNDMLLLLLLKLLLSLRGLLRLLIDLLHVIVIVIATIDDGVFAESEFVARMQLLVAHKALEAAQMVDEMTRSHYELVRRYALCTAVTLSWKPLEIVLLAIDESIFSETRLLRVKCRFALATPKTLNMPRFVHDQEIESILNEAVTAVTTFRRCCWISTTIGSTRIQCCRCWCYTVITISDEMRRRLTTWRRCGCCCCCC